MEGQYNLRNPAVKRLMKEAQELKDPTEQYHAQPLEDNLFEWHFTVRGPPDSDFDGGVYHGRIVLPPEYPMKPPSIILLTPNGRFEVGKKICLSISGHHPETWQPSWSIRTALLAIIGFMPTKGEGAIGSLDYTPDERKALAKKSQDYNCENCGSHMRTALLPCTESSIPSMADVEAKELAKQISFKAETGSAASTTAEPSPAPIPIKIAKQEAPVSDDVTFTENNPEIEAMRETDADDTSAGTQEPPQSRPNTTSLSPRQRRTQQQRRVQQQQVRRPVSPSYTQVRQPANANQIGSTVLIVVLTLALAALIFRRIYMSNEYRFDYEL
ncbi:ubiquitin-conjugating enzyme E2 J1 [Chiloscyllium plagiosum]|uniref:ubiquitin-conjugating enzyme E2 J1 n=1 Tax=Chiloscyllium plagiosum TaxID=36176 RepID=UPI001CB7DC30|nr:ubiquitin-conjugating enzyme E2 J1 [Chiloscyllium plagiosum]